MEIYNFLLINVTKIWWGLIITTKNLKLSPFDILTQNQPKQKCLNQAFSLLNFKCFDIFSPQKFTFLFFLSDKSQISTSVYDIFFFFGTYLLLFSFLTKLRLKCLRDKFQRATEVERNQRRENLVEKSRCFAARQKK